MDPGALLQVDDLSVRFRSDAGVVSALNGVSFAVRSGETVALVGESGSGKSVTSLAIMRLTPSPPGCQVGGHVWLRGTDGVPLDLLALPSEAMRKVRGDRIAMIFQEPMTSLNPVLTIGEQIAEAIAVHRGTARASAWDAAGDLLELVGIPEPRARLATYPHHLSGGMRQRVMIAIALSCDPALLIADEPTTALDVTVQAQILDLLRRLQKRTGMAVIFITHNLGVVAEIADRVMVMYAGRIVEQAAMRTLFQAPRMPYTVKLMHSVPRLQIGGERVVLEAIPGSVPDPTNLPPGCAFAPRCSHAAEGRCDAVSPALEEVGAGHFVRCVRWREIADGVGR
ncbi:MAG: ABC transporter ATP-binding protein [Rhodospirillales bacterium]|nr:ABC transporter ATP-binding protein [Rhodospirillales bacterium]